MAEASPLLVAAFVGLTFTVVGAFLVGVRAAARATEPGSAGRLTARAALGAGAWMALTLALAASGRLRFDTMPPTALLMVVVILGLAIGLGRSGLGARLSAGLPLAALVGFHAFRLPLELIMHRAYEIGLMPEQMSYSGLNFDIVTGASAIVVAALLAAGKVSATWAKVWNVVGFGLLLNILTVAMLSTPTPFRVFMNEPANVWITRPPWVWLPAVMVLAAMLGHIVLFRRLHGAGTHTVAATGKVAGAAVR